METLRRFGISYADTIDINMLYMIHLFNSKVWMALLVTIAITMLLSVVNGLYSRSKVVDIDERSEVKLELHWLFLFGLLMSKGIYNINYLCYSSAMTLFCVN